MTPQPANPRVLVVDDRPANRLAFKTLLDSLYTVVLAENGHEALKRALEEEFAVILLDVRMPGMDGFETAELLRKRESMRYTPIVFMSAYDKNDLQAKKGYVAGATDYLFSPVDPDLLKFKVATYAQMYLRNEDLRFQIHELQESVRALKFELSLCSPTRLVQEKMSTLGRQIDRLQRELNEQLV